MAIQSGLLLLPTPETFQALDEVLHEIQTREYKRRNLAALEPRAVRFALPRVRRNTRYVVTMPPPEIMKQASEAAHNHGGLEKEQVRFKNEFISLWREKDKERHRTECEQLWQDQKDRDREDAQREQTAFRGRGESRTSVALRLVVAALADPSLRRTVIDSVSPPVPPLHGGRKSERTQRGGYWPRPAGATSPSGKQRVDIPPVAAEAPENVTLESFGWGSKLPRHGSAKGKKRGLRDSPVSD